MSFENDGTQTTVTAGTDLDKTTGPDTTVTVIGPDSAGEPGAAGIPEQRSAGETADETVITVTPEIDSRPLDYTRELTGEAISAPDHYLDVITLACAVTYRVDDLWTAPYILALGTKGCGKSTLMTVAGYLANGTSSVTGITALTAPSYVAEFRLNPYHTPLLDEVNHLFGQAGNNAKSSRLRTYLNQGNNRGTAYAQFQESSVAVRVPIFGVKFMAGQGLACPDDLRDRSVILPMQSSKRPTSDFSDEKVRCAFEYGGLVLRSWAQGLPRLSVKDVRDLNLHPKLAKRRMDVWGPLFAVAILAGDAWLKRCMTAFERLELDNPVPVWTPETQLLLDYAAYAEEFSAKTGPEEDGAPSFGGLTVPVTNSKEADGIASGEFAAWANNRDHGAYAGMTPGQFKQFATKNLGPTSPFYDRGAGRTVRGWSGQIHSMNIERANSEMERIADGTRPEESPESWEDF